MSVYNGENHLCESIESILSQSYSDFELIIIDDASTDDTTSILNSFSDHRIRITRNETNCGLTRCLNIAIAHARGNYIARMDADDISYPERLEKEFKFLDRHSNYSLVGTFVEVIKPDLSCERIKLPSSYDDILGHILHENCFVHGSLMMRTSHLQRLQAYDESYEYAQDYDLNLRFAFTSEILNIPEYLYAWRENPCQGISIQHRKEQRETANTIRSNAIERFIISHNKYFDVLLNNYINYPQDDVIRAGLLRFIRENKPKLTLRQNFILYYQRFKRWKNILLGLL